MSKKVRSFFSLHNPVLFRFKMGRELKEIVEKIDEIAAERIRFGFTVTTQPQNRDRPQTHSYVDESKVVGREEDKEEIVKLLLAHDCNQNVAVLPIIGMGGLGKTTVAKIIFQDGRVKKHFQPLIWVRVSDEFDVAKLAKAIIASARGTERHESIMKRSKAMIASARGTEGQESKMELLQAMIASARGTEGQESNMELLQLSLREVISGKRYLLVLDDVWNEDQAKWDELKTLLETGGEGSRIIVTARNEQVSSIMRPLYVHHLKGLTEDDSWTLFRKRAFEEGAEEHQNLVSIGKEIVKKCGGLPLAVKTLGGLMHSKSQEREWSSVRDSEIWDMQAGEDGILPALRLSYSHLPSHLKQCFPFCATFPKDYEMEKDLLIQLWMANGFIPSDGRKDRLEEKGHEIFNELVWRFFFQDIKLVEEAEEYRTSLFYLGDRSYRHELYYTTTCKMHDLMHDLAQSISRPDPAKWEEECRRTRHLCTSENVQLNIHRTLNNYPNIRTLLSSIKGFHTTISVTADSSKPRSLRALDLHNTIIPRLPIKAGFLKHLRYLDLSGTFIKALPDATSTLFNLQTLKLSGCWRLHKLPEDMRNMTSLRHLYIDRCDSLKHLPAGIGQLSSLQILTKYIVGNDAGRRIVELNGLNLGGLLELYNLRNVRDAADAKEANLSSKHNLCSLILCWDMIEWHPPYCYADSAHRCCEEDVLPTKNAEEVLEALRPHGGLKLLTIWRYGGGSSPMWMMDFVLLQNLVEIHLGVCTGCQHLPPLWQLPFLKFLYMIKMDSIKHICSSTIYGNASNGTVQAFPSLKRLVLHTMQSLDKWSEYEGTAEVTLNFPHLAELKIIDCPNLKTMPDLPSLKSLQMEGTNKQLGLVCSLTTLSSLLIVVRKTSTGTESPPLAQKQPSFRYFRSLENLAITASEDLAPLLQKEEETRGLSTSLHDFNISHCNWLFSSSQQSSLPLGFWKNLTSLLSLSIRFCDDLVYWPEEEFRSLNSLKRIYIYGCNKLVGPSPLPLSSSVDGELLPNLEKLDIRRCDGLLELPKLPTSLKSLYVLGCPKLNSFTEGLQQRLPGLQCLVIGGCPNLERQCKRGGPYWHLVSRIPYVDILPQRRTISNFLPSFPCFGRPSEV
ncbi:disease resistance protein RGA2-like [Cocos nucifera]|uniref:Disease resistance protein RGA2-like n=1 Tax=Cocos nucifera TaxID=13894 RepID=A0A8K0IY82_COCNU|nr:disease resistance protein RGA2-like [Cocos nucifera]